MNKLGTIATMGILGLGTLGVYAAPLASAHTDCVMDGPRVCAPGNDRGVPAGCYDDGGVLFAPWPCTPWQPSYGWRHADGTTTYPNGDVMTDDGTLIKVGDHGRDIPPASFNYCNDDCEDEHDYYDVGRHGGGGHGHSHHGKRSEA